jgi:heme-degrading monooxygenase HmoA
VKCTFQPKLTRAVSPLNWLEDQPETSGLEVEFHDFTPQKHSSSLRLTIYMEMVMNNNQTPHTFTVMEAGFKILPGKEADFFALQNKMVPVAMSQPGFVSVYGGEILNSSWLYFGVYFETAEQMDAWYRTPAHGVVQKAAYAKWWTSVYIRKWQRQTPGERLGDLSMCETRIVVKAALDLNQIRDVQEALKILSSAGAMPFETRTGEFEPQPYQFAGPLEIAPVGTGVQYSLITHWSSEQQFKDWLKSEQYQVLQRLGDTSSELFTAMTETQPRDYLRDDLLQREWTLEGHR